MNLKKSQNHPLIMFRHLRPTVQPIFYYVTPSITSLFNPINGHAGKNFKNPKLVTLMCSPYMWYIPFRFGF